MPLQLEQTPPAHQFREIYRRMAIARAPYERFAEALRNLLEKLNPEKDEEHAKILMRDFLKEAFYGKKHYLNTKDRGDLALHAKNTAKSPVWLLFETKRPNDRAGMISTENPNRKALQQLIYYFLKERIQAKNTELKHLIITDIYQWFIFDAQDFERLFYGNTKLRKAFESYENEQAGGKKTQFFYSEIAEPFLESLEETLKVTHFNLLDYSEALQDPDRENECIDLYKVFAPEFLLKEFRYDSNHLDIGFYEELLHIMGLEEVNKGGKILIVRKKPAEREVASFLENAIRQIEASGKIDKASLQLPPEYGKTREERLFHSALELTLTWVNRLLFLKLLEGQLLSFHENAPKYRFLSPQVLKNFSLVQRLFFDILAVKVDERHEAFQEDYAHIPYLNSSLFERTPLEFSLLTIRGLDQDLPISYSPQTILRDGAGKVRKGKDTLLNYFLSFLDAYNFNSDSTQEIQEHDKRLINAAVLGLIFEKINGYQDGSFFTPGFITMYMCRETLRRAVIQKFNTKYAWQCENFVDLYNQVSRISVKEANDVIDDLKICDPAVGSGHFLVSALNELIAIKAELEILCDAEGKRLPHYVKVAVEDDDLSVWFEQEGEKAVEHSYSVQEYPEAKLEGKFKVAATSQRVQEALFQQKRHLIENCLFAVDLNPNSVKICNLRLWIELLKYAYYKKETHFRELETLPNLDINIKVGNSLVSRFGLNGQKLPAGMRKKMKTATEQYKNAVIRYRSVTDRREKDALREELRSLRTAFESMANPTDKEYIELKAKKAKLEEIPILFDKKEREAYLEQRKLLTEEVAGLQAAYEEKLRTVYSRAHEWRFAFPEVLNEDGDFVGFDVVIGNPPYISSKEIQKYYKPYFSEHFRVAKKQYDLYSLFIELSLRITVHGGFNSLIIPDSVLARTSFSDVRKMLKEETTLFQVTQTDKVFEKANVSSCIYVLRKEKAEVQQPISFKRSESMAAWKAGDVKEKYISFLTEEPLNSYRLLFLDEKDLGILRKFYTHKTLQYYVHIWRGEEIGKKAESIKEKRTSKNDFPLITGAQIGRYSFKGEKRWIAKKDVQKELTFYEKEKIVIRQLGERIFAQVDEQKSITVQSVYNLFVQEDKNHSLSNLALLGILNSQLIHFVYQSVYAEKQQFPRILIENIKNFCIPKVTEKENEQLAKKVKKIIALKKANPSADTSVLEAEIDELVYALYGLTPEEVALVAREG